MLNYLTFVTKVMRKHHQEHSSGLDAESVLDIAHFILIKLTNDAISSIPWIKQKWKTN